MLIITGRVPARTSLFALRNTGRGCCHRPVGPVVTGMRDHKIRCCNGACCVGVIVAAQVAVIMRALTVGCAGRFNQCNRCDVSVVIRRIDREGLCCGLRCQIRVGKGRRIGFNTCIVASRLLCCCVCDRIAVDIERMLLITCALQMCSADAVIACPSIGRCCIIPVMAKCTGILLITH